MEATKIFDGIFHIGANVENGDLFEGLWPIPHGVSLNSYIVKGDQTAMIDLMCDWDSAPVAMTSELGEIGVDYGEIDYLVLNHLEPDHTGWLNGFLERTPKCQILLTQRAADLVKEFYGITENVKVVKDGETLDLGGGKTLVFYEAPNVHWPETMVTYESSTGVLFSCDAFGSYGSLGDKIFDDQLDSEKHKFYEDESLRYYANIVASFSTFVTRAINKLGGLDIKVIAPSHGIVWRDSPTTVVERYLKYADYANGKTEPEISIVWGSMYGNTQALLKSVMQGIRSEGVKVNIHRVPNEDPSFVLASVWKSTGLVLGMPTYEYKMFPPMAHIIDLFERKKMFHKKVFRFGSFGWSGGAQKEFDAITEKLKWDFIEPLEWKGLPTEDVHTIAIERGKQLAREVNQICGVTQ